MIRLNVRVREEVSLQIAPLIETPGTNGTFVRRLLHMQNFVYCQGPALAKSFATLAALERLLFAVDVSAKIEKTFSVPTVKFPFINYKFLLNHVLLVLF